MNPIIQVSDLRFAFAGTAFRLRIDELSVEPGESVALIGPSGSGKTTLLHLIAGVLLPAAGCLMVDGIDVTSLDDASRRDFRIRQIGMVFQEFELLEHLSVLDNILLPYRISPSLALTDHVIDRATALAASVDIGDKKQRFTGRLSQGERQRVAVCRALVTEPKLVFADEPTGNLDPNNKWKVLEILLDDCQRRGSTLITVTHDHELLDRFDRVIDFAAYHSEAASEDPAEAVG
jgi:putative ABC transport system ATP-binding protein